MAEEIVLEILWSDSAKVSFNKIVDYLRKEWTNREVEKFVQRTVEWLATLKRYPEMCRPSTKRKYVRIGILDKHSQIIYHYKPKKKEIELLLFWSMKQNPVRFKY